MMPVGRTRVGESMNVEEGLWCLGCLLQALCGSSVELQRFRAASQSPLASASQEEVPKEGSQPKLQ